MSVPLVLAASAAIALGVVHSVLGERYIIARMLRRPLPPLFGSDDFTKKTVRFAWHLTTLMCWGLAGAMLSLDGTLDLRTVLVATFAAMAVLTLAIEWRHPSWAVEGGIAALLWASR